MGLIYHYSFNTAEKSDGVRESNGKKLPVMYNFGTWPYMDEVSYDYGEGGCVLWRSKLCAAVTAFDGFNKSSIDIMSTYVLTLRIRILKPLNDELTVGFFRGSGDFNVLNDGPLKGMGPFTRIGNSTKIDRDSIIKAVDIGCNSATEDFFDIKVSVDGSYICKCMEFDLENSPVYVGIMNFAHRYEPDDIYFAVSDIRIESELSNMVFAGMDFYGLPQKSADISIAVKYFHNGVGNNVKSDGADFKITDFLLALCSSIDLKTKTIHNNQGSVVIVSGFSQDCIYDEISFSPIIMGVTNQDKKQSLFGETITFTLAEIYLNKVKNEKDIPLEITDWFKPVKNHKINLYNDEPVNPDFLGFGALYYPWIYLKDEDGRNYTEEQAKVELDYLKISGVRIARTNLFVNSAWYNESDDSWNISGEEFNGLLRSFTGISERGIDIMLNFEWGNSINFGPVFADEELAKYPFDKQCKMFGDFVCEFLRALKTGGVKTVKYLTFFSEPANGITNGFESEEGKKLIDRYEKCIGTVHNALTAAGIRKDYKMILGNVALGTEIWNYTWQYFEPIYSVLKPFADGWSYHNYNKYGSLFSNTASPFENMMAYVNEDIIKKTGVTAKDVWIDEYNATDRNNTWFEYRNSCAWNPIHIIAGMVADINVGYKTVLNWTFINTLWVGSHTNGKDNWKDGMHCWGLIPHPSQDERPYNSFYAYQMVASHVTSGKTYRGDNTVESNLCCCACENDDGTFTVIVVNSGVFAAPFELNFSKSLNDLTFSRYLFESSKNYRSKDVKTILPNKKFKNIKGSLKDVIPGGSVAVYTTMP